MTQRCTVCAHEQRKEIDAALVQGKAFTVIARQYGLHHDAVNRHSKSHLSTALVKLKAEREVAGVRTALDRLESLYERTERLLDQAETDGVKGLQLQAIRELRSCLETIAKITGELDEKPTVTVNLAGSPEWAQLQTLILLALQPYPDARLAVADAIDVMGEIEP